MTLITTHAHLSCVPCNGGSHDEIQGLLSIVGGIIELRAIHTKSRQITGRQFFKNREGCIDLQEVLAFIHKHTGDDIYFAPAARKDPTSGGLKNCAVLCCLFCDLDYKDFPSPEIGRQELEAFPLKPSYIVETGGGLHCYWMLKNPFDLQTEGARAKDLLRRLAITLGGDLASAEPAHLLRVPQTFNYKYNPPRLVKIENRNCDEVPYYRVSDFDFLPAELKPHRPATEVSRSNGIGDSSEIIPASERIRRASGYLATIPGAIQGSGGDSHTYKTACHLRDFGLHLEECVALMMVEFNPRCFDPRIGRYNSWSYPRMREKVSNAYAYGKGPFGSKLHEKPPPPVPHLVADQDLAEKGNERKIIGGDDGECESENNSILSPTELNYIEFAPSFLAADDPPIEYLVNELLPRSVISLDHGEPRTRKTWAALEVAIAVATGTPAFGLERFQVPQSFPVLYSSQEDAARDVRIRAKALLAGRGIQAIPETLAFSVHKGINLDSREWQQALIRDILKYGFRLFILDPIRRYSPGVDKGPAEVRQITAFLRRICVETGATVKINHHDVKPSTDNRDERRRSHKASGGDWFAAAECPISYELAGENRTMVIPEDYKFSRDPQPFIFRLETDDPRNPTIARLIGETTSAEDTKTAAVRHKIIEYLDDHSAGASGNAIIKACRIRREDGFAMLDRLSKDGLVDRVGLGGKGKKQAWFLTNREEKRDAG
jgi:hypothetical protein